MHENSSVSRLTERLATATEMATSVARDIQAEVPEKAAESLLKLPGLLFQAGFKSISRKIRSHRAHQVFEQQWAAARNREEQEAAVRKLTESDPTLAGQLNEGIQQRDYLMAVRALCRELPFLAAAFPTAFIEDVFIDLPVSVTSSNSEGGTKQAGLRVSTFIEQVVSDRRKGNHQLNYACFGGPGSGKTTLCRSLAARYCDLLLQDEEAAADHALVLPAFVRAAELVKLDRPFIERLKLAIEHELTQYLKHPLDETFFADRLKNTTRRWLVIIDGFDEISDPQRRLTLLRAVRDVYLGQGNTFRFVVSCRDTAMAQEAFGNAFGNVRLDDVSWKNAIALFGKYSRALGVPFSADDFYHAPLRDLRSILKTPLLIAIASKVLSEAPGQRATLFELFDDFIKSLLTKRGHSASDSRMIRELLTEFADQGELVTLNRTHLARSAKLGVIEDGLPTAMAKQALIDRLVASGLVLANGGGVRFVHTSFRLFFRAMRFAELHSPAEKTWELLDPHRNGWDFTQFALERWNADGQDMGVVCKALLSYGEEGLELLSRIAGNNPKFPRELVQGAISKWRLNLEDNPLDCDAVGNLSVMAHSHAPAVDELQRIAMNPWIYHGSSLDAARCLARHNRVENSRVALLKITTVEYPPDQALAAQALCEIGFREEGVRLMKQYLIEWSRPEDYWLLGYLWAIEGLHENAESQLANHALDEIKTQEGLTELDVHSVAKTCAKVRGLQAALAYLEGWLALRPDITHASEILKLAAQDIDDHRLSELLKADPAPDYYAKQDQRLRELLQRLKKIPTENLRLLALVRNRYLNSDYRYLALGRLSDLDDTAYCTAALDLIADTNFLPYQKKEIIANLRGRDIDKEMMAALNRCTQRKEHQDGDEAELFANVGGRAQGIRLLTEIAGDLTATQPDRANAICMLADLGSSAIALRYFRDMLSSRAYTTSLFEKMGKALFVTEHAAEFAQLLWSVLRQRAQPTAIRLKTADLLYKPELKKEERRAIARFLQRTARRKNTSLEDRFEALDQLQSFNVDEAFEICLDLAENPNTPFAEGMEAAKRVARWGDWLSTVDAYTDVVWDKKLSLPQHIEGLLYIRSHVGRFSDAEQNFEELISRAEAKLAAISQNRDVQASLRLAALGLPRLDSARSREPNGSDDEWPPEGSIRIFLNDEAVAPRLKQECVARLHPCKPRLASSHHAYLEMTDGDCTNTMYCLSVLANMGHSATALSRYEEIARNPRVTVSNRLKGLKHISDLGKSDLAFGIAAALPYDVAGKVAISRKVLTEVCGFLLEHGIETEVLRLCQDALAPPVTYDHEYLEIASFLARHCFLLEAQAALRRLLKALSCKGAVEENWVRWRVAGMLEDLGGTEEAIIAYGEIAHDNSTDLLCRIQSCHSLASLDHKEEALEVLSRLSRKKSLTVYDRIALAKCCMEFEMLQIARELVFAAVAEPVLSSHQRQSLHDIGVQLGIESRMPTIEKNSVENETSRERIERLVGAEEWGQVKEVLKVLIDDAEAHPSEIVEILEGLSDTPLESATKNQLRTSLESDTDIESRIRAAVVLDEMGESDVAREVLPALAQSSRLKAEDRLWLAQALIGINFDELAYEQLEIVQKKKRLQREDREMLQELLALYAA